MKTTIHFVIILLGVTQLSISQETVSSVTKEKVSPSENSSPMTGKYDALFRIRINQTNEDIPDLTIPTYSSIRTRIVDTRTSKGRMEIAIQVDEFFIDYFDYRLDGGKWALKSQKRVCALSGPRSLALAQVNLLEDGVELRFINSPLEGGKVSWENELINKIYQHKLNVQTERYTLKGEEYILVGKPFDPDLILKNNAPKQDVDAKSKSQ